MKTSHLCASYILDPHEKQLDLLAFFFPSLAIQKLDHGYLHQFFHERNGCYVFFTYRVQIGYNKTYMIQQQ